MRYIALMCLAFIMFSCENTTSFTNVSKFYDDGRARPVVAVTHVVDSTSYDVPWSLSDEFSQLIRDNLANNPNLYLTDQAEIDQLVSSADNPFNPDIAWMKEKFDNNEFVVFLELIKHDDAKSSNVTNLDMSMRVKVVDVRSKEPKILLQETVNDNYYISKGSISSDYSLTTWGSEEFENSRMGMAHKQIAKEITSRISDYISLAKSR